MADLIVVTLIVIAGAVCCAAAGYRYGCRDGAALERRRQGAMLAIDLSRLESDEARLWKQRSSQMGAILRDLGYAVLEIEDPHSGEITYQAQLVQPGIDLPIGGRYPQPPVVSLS